MPWRSCESFATENNLEFSTDPDPKKSKSKCIFMQGNLKLPKPVILKLYGCNLPASHLDIELSEQCNMEYDMKCKRADFISKSTEIREMFAFAQPHQILQATRTYCCSMYGAMTWNLFGVQLLVYMCEACLGSSKSHPYLLGGQLVVWGSSQH